MQMGAAVVLRAGGDGLLAAPWGAPGPEWDGVEAPAGGIQGVAWAEPSEGSHWGQPVGDARAPWGAQGDSSGPAPGLSAALKIWPASPADALEQG